MDEVNFNPRSHEGSDKSGKHTVVYSVISIHAPTRGATKTVSASVLSKGISIHAPTRGATRISMSGLDTHTNFNPRSHEGSDRNMGFLFSPYRISIHAPTRGATLLGEESCVAIHRFQSTLPRGERLFWLISDTQPKYFNPRSHEGSDRYGNTYHLKLIRFQSTLPRGERLFC